MPCMLPGDRPLMEAVLTMAPPPLSFISLAPATDM